MNSLSAALLAFLTIGCASSPTSPVTAPSPPPAPRLELSDEASFEEALLERFDEVCADPAELERNLRASATRFPEGDVLPPMLATAAYGQLVLAGRVDPERALPSMAALVHQTRLAVERHLGADPATLEVYSGQGTMLSELAYALGWWRLTAEDERWDGLHHHVVGLLDAALRAEGLVESYPGQTWPIDSVVALAALRLHARAFERAAPDALVDATLARIDTEGLPPSRVDTHTPLPPRGSDLSWRLVLLRDLDAERARRLYTRYVDVFWRSGSLYAGFAEWEDGRDAPDVDSGPIFEGVGATASTFGIATTRAFDDSTRHRRLVRQLPLGRMLVEENDGRHLAGLDIDARWVTGSIMGDATLFYALTWRAEATTRP